MSSEEGDNDSQGEGQADLFDLPHKLWRAILDQLSPRMQARTLANLRLTCKAMQDIANFLVTTIQVTPKKQELVLPHQVIQYFPYVHTIIFDNRLITSAASDHGGIEHPIEEAWQPERFGLLVSHGLSSLADLTTIKFTLTGALQWLPFTHMALLLSSCSKLHSLSFPAMLYDGVLKDDFEQRIAESSMLIRPLVQLLPLSLRHLAISQCVEADKEALSDLSRLVGLRSLTLEDCSCACLSPEVTQGWSALTSFESLTFRHCMAEPVVLKQVLTATAPIPSLTSLCLRSQHRLGFDGSQPLAPLAGFTGLRYLELGSASDQAITLGRSDLLTLGGLPRLEELHLDLDFSLTSDARGGNGGASPLPSPGGQNLGRLFAGVTKATLGYWRGGAADLLLLLRLLRGLTSLHLSRCPSAPQELLENTAGSEAGGSEEEVGLGYVAGLSRLQELRVTYPGEGPHPAALTDEVLATWAESLTQLTTFELNHTEPYPLDGGAATDTEDGPESQQLVPHPSRGAALAAGQGGRRTSQGQGHGSAYPPATMYGFGLVTNDGLATLARGMSQLRTLRVSGLHGVTPHVLVPLGQKGRMRSVEVSNCRQIRRQDGELVTQLLSMLVPHPVSVHVL